MQPNRNGVRLFVTFDTGPVAEANEGIAVTGTNTYYSQLISGSRGMASFAVRLNWTGTPTGALTLWWTNKASPNLATDADWTQDTGFAPINPAGAAGSYGDVGVGNTGAALWRVKYVNASGTGVMLGDAHVQRYNT